VLEEKTIRDILPHELQGKVYPVGRLDKESGGLLLLTNDGPLAYRLTHPKFDHEKEYDVEVNNPITDAALQQMADGILIQGVRTKPTQLKRNGPSGFRIILTEGKNRQIRRMCEKLGYRVIRLTRTRILSLTDPSMKSGDLRLLTKQERLALLKEVGIS
jgi:pseudouridine synthase